MKLENYQLKLKCEQIEQSLNKHLTDQENTLKQEVNFALLAQKERYTIRHEGIVKLLQQRYKSKLDSLSDNYQSQIHNLTLKLKSISEELLIAKKCLLSTHERNPIFSPGHYHGLPP